MLKYFLFSPQLKEVMVLSHYNPDEAVYNLG